MLSCSVMGLVSPEVREVSAGKKASERMTCASVSEISSSRAKT